MDKQVYEITNEQFTWDASDGSTDSDRQENSFDAEILFEKFGIPLFSNSDQYRIKY
jgi:hypothetical protein